MTAFMAHYHKLGECTRLFQRQVVYTVINTKPRGQQCLIYQPRNS